MVMESELVQGAFFDGDINQLFEDSGAFTLPDTKTEKETETDTDTNNLAQNPMRICVDICTI